MAEYVLAIPRTELDKQKVGKEKGAGLYPIDLTKLDPTGFAFLPRHIVDDKSEHSLALGLLYPQILGYYQIEDPKGRILTYRRKGKEKGLLGKYSIGVGGHIDLGDYAVGDTLTKVIYEASARELYEEIGVAVNVEAYPHNRVLSILTDKTSQVHVGLPATIKLPQNVIDALVYDEREFPGVEWLTRAELKTLSQTETFEPWSQILINNF